MNKKLTILPQSILAEAKKANSVYSLVEKGDKILVGLSGGKDSISLVYLLKYFQEGLRMDFEFKAVMINYGSGEKEDKALEKTKKYFKENLNIEVEIFKTNLLDLIQKKGHKNKNLCSFVARMRRGMLNKKAEEWGANKIALGHHLDDAVETLFMSMFYSGKIRSMAPKYKAENGIEIIRPLIWNREKEMRWFVNKYKIPTIGNEFCIGLKSEKKSHVRAEIKNFIQELEKENKLLFQNLKRSLMSVDLNSLFIPLKKKKWWEFWKKQ